MAWLSRYGDRTGRHFNHASRPREGCLCAVKSAPYWVRIHARYRESAAGPASADWRDASRNKKPCRCGLFSPSASFFLRRRNNYHSATASFPRFSWGTFSASFSRFPLRTGRARRAGGGDGNGDRSGNGHHGGRWRWLNYCFLFFACI